MRIRREQSYHWQRVDTLACSTLRAVGKQLRALVGGGQRLGYDQELHKAEDARTRFSVEARNRKDEPVFSRKSMTAQAIESVHAGKREYGFP